MVDLLVRGGSGRGCCFRCEKCGTEVRTSRPAWTLHREVSLMRSSPSSQLRLRRDGLKTRRRPDVRACKEEAGDGAGTSGLEPVQSASTNISSSNNIGSSNTAVRQSCMLSRSSGKPKSGLATAVHFACNDAILMDERARSDVAILAQGFLRLDMRARQDVALIGSSFLKLDARAREDSGKLDIQARDKVERLRSIARHLQELARMEAKEHWNDGGLDADLRLADLRARRRAMEDAYASVMAVKNVHTALVRIVRVRDKELGNRGKYENTQKPPPKDWPTEQQLSTGNVVLDRLIEIEEAYAATASLLAEADGIDCSDPDELELVVATLMDMDEVDGGNGASLLAECSTSPDVATRRALADALADAPSLWSLGNAGMGALQRLAQDSNSAVATAAAKAINELNQQWRSEDRNPFYFPGLPLPPQGLDEPEE